MRSVNFTQPEQNPQYGKIVSERHYQRLLSFLNDGVPLTGGQFNPEHYKIAPTILDQVKDDSPVMQEEIFGFFRCLHTAISMKSSRKSNHAQSRSLFMSSQQTKESSELF